MHASMVLWPSSGEYKQQLLRSSLKRTASRHKDSCRDTYRDNYVLPLLLVFGMGEAPYCFHVAFNSDITFHAEKHDRHIGYHCPPTWLAISTTGLLQSFLLLQHSEAFVGLSRTFAAFSVMLLPIQLKEHAGKERNSYSSNEHPKSKRHLWNNGIGNALTYFVTRFFGCFGE